MLTTQEIWDKAYAAGQAVGRRHTKMSPEMQRFEFELEAATQSGSVTSDLATPAKLTQLLEELDTVR